MSTMNASMSPSYRVLILGFPLEDLSAGANAHSSALAAFTESADQVIATIRPERLAEVRNGVVGMPEIGIDAVHLAPENLSNLTSAGVETALDSLHDQGLIPFGVGRNLHEAKNPLSVEIPAAAGGGQLNFHASHIRPEGSSNNLATMAEDDRAGLAPLSTQEVPRPRLENERLDAFHLAMPSWRKKSAWRNTTQYALVHQMLNKDFDLVLGTGTQRLQEVHRKRERWVVYGLGESPSTAQNQPGHSPTGVEEPPPFALWAMLEIHGVDGSRRVTLKLYPVEDSGEATGTRAVSAEDFETIVSALAERPLRPWRFRNPAMTTGSDGLGHHLALDLGAWPTDQRPSRLENLTPTGDPNESPRLTPSAELEDAATRINRPPGPMILPLGAEAKGAKVHWLADSTSVITLHGKRFLTNGVSRNDKWRFFGSGNRRP
ncbi:hypothetical protein FEF26_08180 [Nesterenkonia salmonea]|uniref:Capsule synthesis protein CapA domain-containing protein n=1 Tax=Nesterenkonia salmonea TaxID=1804987 RepID=A0A5R9BC40_9MICC|nr:CapA family protein [Nesterenkonia salmonea]TLP97069.1 hypothetical protein FEF26_08180 [Nesterenkonia salmonea]